MQAAHAASAPARGKKKETSPSNEALVYDSAAAAVLEHTVPPGPEFVSCLLAPLAGADRATEYARRLSPAGLFCLLASQDHASPETLMFAAQRAQSVSGATDIVVDDPLSQIVNVQTMTEAAAFVMELAVQELAGRASGAPPAGPREPKKDPARPLVQSQLDPRKLAPKEPARTRPPVKPDPRSGD